MRKLFSVLFILIFLFETGVYSFQLRKEVTLSGLLSIEGRCVILKERIICFENKEFSLKAFDKKGKLVGKKVIKGEGPGEVSVALGSYLLPFGEDNFLVVETQRRKWSVFNSKLELQAQGRFPEPISVLRFTRKGVVAGLASMGDKYYRKIFLFSKDLKKSKRIFYEEGEEIGKKVKANNLYITLDAEEDLIAFSQGGAKEVKVINFNGKLLSSLSLRDINPSVYSEEEMNFLAKKLPPVILNVFEFKKLPYVIQVFLLGGERLLVVTGEKIRGKFKSLWMNWKSKKVEKEDFIVEGFYIKGDEGIWVLREKGVEVLLQYFSFVR